MGGNKGGPRIEPQPTPADKLRDLKKIAEINSNSFASLFFIMPYPDQYPKPGPDANLQACRNFLRPKLPMAPTGIGPQHTHITPAPLLVTIEHEIVLAPIRPALSLLQVHGHRAFHASLTNRCQAILQTS